MNVLDSIRDFTITDIIMILSGKAQQNFRETQEPGGNNKQFA